MIYLPFPPKSLSPNARLHWSAIAREKKAFRLECFFEARRQGITKLKEAKALTVALEFFPPDRRARDWDNMLAAMKSGLDGLADALGVDDRNWRLTFTVSEKPDNRVAVEINPMQ